MTRAPTPGAPRLAVDIGGTFTDVVLETPSGMVTAKVLTTPQAPEKGVMTAIAAVLAQSAIAPSEIAVVIHGTTLATNALIERKGAKTALVTTRGFRDSIEMAYEHRFDQYDLQMERPQPIVPRRRRYGVEERLAADGTVVLPLAEDEVRALVDPLRREQVEAVAIGFLHSYIDARHERRAGEILADQLPHLAITISSDVCREIREYERFTTAACNAYVQPLMAGYLGRLELELLQSGIGCPFFLMMSNGAVTTLEIARAQPIRMVESGPAGGAIFASSIAVDAGYDKVLSFDMGGTTAKICLIDDFTPQVSRVFEVARQERFLKGSGLPLRTPVIDMVEIGAGGGSIASIDALRRIQVGPQSAGSTPGPAAYGRGGTAATVTDADLVMGRIDPQRFAAGKVSLDPGLAERALGSAVAEPLQMTTSLAAAAVCEIVDENMANAARVHAVESGKDLEPRTLIAFGGAAPLHAARLAEKLAMTRVVIPADAGVGSAVGFLRAPVAYDVVQSSYLDLRAFEPAVLNELMKAMSEDATAIVRLAEPSARLEEHRDAFMRYRGQGHEIVVPLPTRDLSSEDRTLVEEAFADAYASLYGRTIPNLGSEIVSLRVTVTTPRERAEVATAPPANVAPPATGERHVFDLEQGRSVEVPTHWRPDLAPGAVIEGPAVIAEEGTSTIVTHRFRATVDARLNLVLQARGTTSHDQA